MNHPSKSLIVSISADGESMMFIAHHPALQALTRHGEARQTRASHVEPVNVVLRWAFHIIRTVVDDDSAMAQWTRDWPCLWQANLQLSNGPVLAAFTNRQAAIDAEIEWLQDNNFGRS
jgi:hypothetical protein